MKKLAIFIITFVSVLSIGFALSPSSFAVDVNQVVCKRGGSIADSPTGATPPVCTTVNNGTTNPFIGPHGILSLIINALSIVLGIVAVVSIIISGVRMSTAAGDTNSIASAKKGIIYAIAALFIAGLSQAIVLLILDRIK